MNVNGYITDRDVVAARSLLRWKQTDLKEKSGVGVATIRRFETGSPISDESKDTLVTALTKAGIVFFGHMEIDGVRVSRGVALRPSARPKNQRKLVYSQGPKKKKDMDPSPKQGSD